MLKLTVVNRMLATLGQAPLNSLSSNSRWLGACLSALDQSDVEVQSRGWWFNEETVTLQPSALDSRIYLPGDTASVSGDIVGNGIVQRGNRLYDLKNGTDLFTQEVTVTLRRQVPFEELPEQAANWIAAEAVYWFQTTYDGDEAKTRRLDAIRQAARMMFKAEDTTQRGANLVDSNRNVQLVRSFSRRQGYRIPTR
jgi:hypothetical protein